MKLCLIALQAAELAVKFLDQKKGLEVIQVVGPRLVDIEEYNSVSWYRNVTLSWLYVS